ncbi:acyl-CoA dehydrogenase family protein [Phycicoccus sp. M110.8]|uniref:acyl-CoA dehydrogenase family protein n=1 Tax=Phycicoccus sp. M110.8 TaxID=3075433 RepID=UPI0028FD971F|nr:acyl-CoA dehydrogenase family protein [Phycicoccus sp. M110.8]MDU0313891.1 acyl-CoA dehydrogenase family protein [Phycicoccus sp. M110.8]
MAFDFSISPALEEQRRRVAEFVVTEVVPLEQRVFRDGMTDALRRDLQGRAKAAGVFAPQAPREHGGGGFRFDESAVLLEEAGYSLLGPLALNCAAPDEGNIHLIHQTGTPEQHAAYLRPLVSGEVRSCFSMTEPPPGAGSDPSALRTTARRVDGGWVLDGDKWLITGADGAAFSIVMARNTGDDAPEGATMFLVDADNPGFVVGDHIDTIDATGVGGHCRVTIRDCFVPDDRVLGEPGRGFQSAQVRLAPARLTHCMRWLGAARRAHDIALERAVGRELFGSRLADLGMAQALIAENEIDLDAARTVVRHAAWQIAEGSRSSEESSRAKVFVSEAVCRVVDRSVQLAGGMGTSEELVLGRIYRDIRSFRIYDGATEVHKMSIARRAAKRAAERLAARGEVLGHRAADGDGSGRDGSRSEGSGE